MLELSGVNRAWRLGDSAFSELVPRPRKLEERGLPEPPPAPKASPEANPPLAEDHPRLNRLLAYHAPAVRATSAAAASPPIAM